MFICQVCKKNPATIHLTDIHNNVKKKAHLCEECAADKGFSMQTAASLPQLLGLAAKNKIADGPKPGGHAPEEDVLCPKCGYRWSDFKSKGRLGCPEDYRVFKEKLHPLIAGQVSAAPIADPLHVGKAPGRRGDPDPKRREIRRLECDLQCAVKEERYEDAAHIKAEIGRLREQGAAAVLSADHTGLN